MPSDLLAGDGGFSQSESMESSVKGCENLYYSKTQARKDCLAWVPSNSHFGNGVGRVAMKVRITSLGGMLSVGCHGGLCAP